MAWFCFWQQRGGDETWSLALAETRERLIRERKPAFVTILDTDNDFRSEMTAEDLDKVHYRGSFYVDFDASSLEEVIPQFKKFISRLHDDYNVDLHQVGLFASGGKGFHITMPIQLFVEKPSPRGYQHLPAIYREIAMEMYVDTLDQRVYTARKGRMFRVSNVERPDKPGIYKVPLTVEEAATMTPEMYRELVQGPRPEPSLQPPVFNPELALLFASATDKVDKAFKDRKKSKVDVKLLQRFGGNVPPSILSVMSGDNVAHGVGFQKLATQLALTAHALGKTEEQFLSLCSGLCEKHQSDGTRYDTPSKRRRELSRMYQYMNQNPCYQFSIGGIKSLIAKDVKTPDLDNGSVELEEEEDESGEGLDPSLCMGMRLSASGVWKRTEEGLQKVSSVGLSNPKQLIDLSSDQVVGYEVDVHVDGKKKGTKLLDMGTFTSRSKFVQFTLAAGGANMSATDPQVGALADILRHRASRNNKSVFITGREGLDVITLPNGDLDVIWADKDLVVSREGIEYRLMGTFMDEESYKTDLRLSPILRPVDFSIPQGDEGKVLLADNETGEYFSHLFQINTDDVLARMLGWFFASFFCQPLRHLFDQFPSMQVFGPAGSGKSKTTTLLTHLHYWKRKPVIVSAIGNTTFVLENMATGSASIPLVIDEVKPREMRKDRIDSLKMLLRNNYQGTDIGKGRVSSKTGESRLDIRRGRNSAPLVFIGEALESQSAILERCVMVSMNKDGKRGRGHAFRVVSSEPEVLASLGRLCLDKALNVNLKGLRKSLLTHQSVVEEAVGGMAMDSDRPVFNIATVLLGLEFGKKVMHDVFGSDFDDSFNTLSAAILSQNDTLVPRIMSEAAKVLDTLAYLSAVSDEEQHRLQLGIDYCVVGEYVDLHVRNCYTKYVRYRRSMGEEVLYDSYEAFALAMSAYPATLDKVGIGSPLKVSSSTQVYRLDREMLGNDGVGEFYVTP